MMRFRRSRENAVLNDQHQSSDSAAPASTSSATSATSSASASFASATAAAAAMARLQAQTRLRDAQFQTLEARAQELEHHQKNLSTWDFYRVACQFRFGYFSFLVMMVILMFSFCLLMEIFFSIFLPSAKYDRYYYERAVVFLLLLPFLLVLLSYCFEEALRFFTDAVSKSQGSLPNFRLAMAVVIHYLRHYSDMQEIPVDTIEQQQEQQQDDAVQQAANLRRTSLVQTLPKDPFSDEYPDEELQQVIDEQQEQEMAVLEAHIAKLPTLKPATSKSTCGRPKQRWRRAIAAVRTMLLMRKALVAELNIEHSTFVMVDLICPVLFEVFTLTAFSMALLATMSPYTAFLAYVRVGFYFVGAYLGLWIIAHFWSSRNPRMRLIVSTYRRKRRTLERSLNDLRRRNRAEHLWLVDIGFRFYSTVGVLFNPDALWSRLCNSCQCCAKKQNEEVTTTAPTGFVHCDETHCVASSDAVLTIDEEAPSPSNTRTQLHAMRLANLRHARSHMRRLNPWYRASLNVQILILSVLVALSALLSLWSFLFGWPLMGLCLVLLGNAIQKRFPQVFGHAFRSLILAFVLISLVFFSSTWTIGTFTQGGKFKLDPPSHSDLPSDTTSATASMLAAATEPSTSLVWGSFARYPVCSVQVQSLTIIDFALIADAVYGINTSVQQEAMRNRFAGTDLADWKYVARNNETSTHQVWMELFFPKANLTVIAVRGTASATDALEDMHFWFGITIMQFVDIFFPFLNQLPRNFVVNLLSMRFFTSIMPSPVYEKLLHHVEREKERVGNNNLVITGHSLGGAMAAMIGAKTHIPAVSFSGPGLVYTRGRFDVEDQAVRDYVLTIKPSKDIVPRVDELGGMIQEIHCREKSFMSCHSTFTHLCELYGACGDARGRNWSNNEQCKRYLALSAVN